MRIRIVTVALVVTVLASPWSAGTAWSQGNGLSRVSRYAGNVVWVLDRAGRQLLVRVVSATDSELAVTIGGMAQTIPVSDVTQVWIDRDSLKNGAIIGALIGIPLGYFSCQGVRSDCEYGGHILFGAAFYGGVGALIDKLHHGRTVLYRAPEP